MFGLVDSIRRPQALKNHDQGTEGYWTCTKIQLPGDPAACEAGCRLCHAHSIGHLIHWWCRGHPGEEMGRRTHKSWKAQWAEKVREQISGWKPRNPQTWEGSYGKHMFDSWITCDAGNWNQTCKLKQAHKQKQVLEQMLGLEIPQVEVRSSPTALRSSAKDIKKQEWNTLILCGMPWQASRWHFVCAAPVIHSVHLRPKFQTSDCFAYQIAQVSATHTLDSCFRRNTKPTEGLSHFLFYCPGTTKFLGICEDWNEFLSSQRQLQFWK